jgi:hypothetical protein
MKNFLMLFISFFISLNAIAQDDKEAIDDDFFNENTKKKVEKPSPPPTVIEIKETDINNINSIKEEKTEIKNQPKNNETPKPVTKEVIKINANGDFIEKKYSYNTDRIFHNDIDLFGYTFIPEKMRFGAEKGEKLLSPGQVNISIVQGLLILKGVAEEGSYSILSMFTKDFGYEIELMNTKNTAQLAKAKILLDNKNQVDAITFQIKAKNGAAYIFLQAYKTDALINKETEFFTSRNKIDCRNAKKSLVGKTIRPYFKIERGPWGVRQNRIYMEDDFGLFFDSTAVKVFKAGGDTIKYSIKKLKDFHEERSDNPLQKYYYEYELIDFPGKYLRLYASATNKMTLFEIQNTQFFLREEEIELNK